MTDLIPDFRVTLDGRDLTAIIHPRLISLTLTECRNESADQLDLALDDTDGQLAIPSKGAKIHLHIGWKHSGLVDKGTFTVDEVEHSGAPDTITLRARTVNLIDTFRRVEEHSFHDTTLGAIIEMIAFRQQLTAGIAEALRNVAIKHIDQTRESDAAFLRRLGKRYDAVATVKNDTLIFMPASRSQTMSGKPLPPIDITRQLGDSHRYHSAERDSYTGVRVFWQDDKQVLRRSVVAGTAGNAKRLRTTYANEADARTAAVAEWLRIQRGLATFELTLAVGNPEFMPQSPVTVSGFKATIDSVDWLTAKVTHSIGSNGFTTAIELETKTEEAEMEREEQSDPDEGITGVTAAWHDKVSKRQGEELAGARGNTKALQHLYVSKQSASRAAQLEWEKIRERREIIEENSRQQGIR
ncbi:phage late control D family protein [Glaciimonas sp. CA11.2]|uniref:phage late control D family protein n=1 Tax=Glaciimonas sp. CA11.2 TaxID=3048601 RepID=UPI002AB35D0D|nr:phage late control D family protein [Glaciimonas sp. CA11.2]MDY7547258.1 phage late control D family protein [Glaciimonas sp. CA11.2]MEB0162404.1 phage late control D family protein [Glaciimonas sp. CA11.2]